MGEIYNYLKQWLIIIQSGNKFKGHDFYAGFPYQLKQRISTEHLDNLYYFLLMIYDYNIKIDLELIESKIDIRNLQKPPYFCNETYVWVLWNILKNIKIKYEKH
jgi:hypothetical protein